MPLKTLWKAPRQSVADGATLRAGGKEEGGSTQPTTLAKLQKSVGPTRVCDTARDLFEPKNLATSEPAEFRRLMQGLVAATRI
jgi:hypothetical protein